MAKHKSSPTQTMPLEQANMESSMLLYSIIFLVIASIAIIFGFSGLAAEPVNTAKLFSS
jgi:hypothetical protein